MNTFHVCFNVWICRHMLVSSYVGAIFLGYVYVCICRHILVSSSLWWCLPWWCAKTESQCRIEGRKSFRDWRIFQVSDCEQTLIYFSELTHSWLRFSQVLVRTYFTLCIIIHKWFKLKLSKLTRSSKLYMCNRDLVLLTSESWP